MAQVYISDVQSSLPRAAKELRAFTKVNLQPGESKEVTLHLDKYALSFYDDQAQCWVAESGTFGVHVGASLVDIKLQGEVKLENTFTWTGL